MTPRLQALAAILGFSLGLLATASAHAADGAPGPKTGQQTRMKNCHAEAKTKALKGAERKSFMSECLKAK